MKLRDDFAKSDENSATKKRNKRKSIVIEEIPYNEKEFDTMEIVEKIPKSKSKVNLKINVNVLQCSICFKFSSTRGDLAKHIRRVHKKEKPFSCIFVLINVTEKQIFKVI